MVMLAVGVSPPELLPFLTEVGWEEVVGTQLLLQLPAYHS